MSTAYNTPTSISCVCYKCRATQFYWLNTSPIAFFRSQNWFKIALVGLGIHFQNGQRDNFSHQPPCFYANSFGVHINVKSSLTSGFFEKYASTQHSSFMMPAWGTLQWKMTRKTLIYRQLTLLFAKQNFLSYTLWQKKKKIQIFLIRKSLLCLHYI